MKKLGIYIHIPFCVKKCGYCDFYSVKWDEESENKYIHSAINEIKATMNCQVNMWLTVYISEEELLQL